MLKAFTNACALKLFQAQVILKVKDEAISARSDLRFSGSICHLFVLFLKQVLNV